MSDVMPIIDVVGEWGIPLAGFYFFMKHGLPWIQARFDEHIETFKEQRDYERTQRNEDRAMVRELSANIVTMSEAIKQSCRYRDITP